MQSLLLADGLVYVQRPGQQLFGAGKGDFLTAHETERDKEAQGAAAFVAVKTGFGENCSDIRSGDFCRASVFLISGADGGKAVEGRFDVVGIRDPVNDACPLCKSAADQQAVRHAFGRRRFNHAVQTGRLYTDFHTGGASVSVK